MRRLELRVDKNENYAITGDKKTILTLWVTIKRYIIDTKEENK